MTSMNAEELSRQLQLLKLDLKDRSKETLVGSERLVKEFASLSLPIETEVNIFSDSYSYYDYLNIKQL